MRIEKLKKETQLLPKLPGVYQFLNNSGNILYVGKAKDLRKRVSSYFLASGKKSFKQNVLINQICSIEHIVVENESDALLLENNLIKKHQPKYNVLLKDDKTFPWICIKNERFPRVFLTRKIINDGSEYFGPYTSVQTVRNLLELVKHLYKLRNCNYLLLQKTIEEKKFKVCLEYHIGNCLGPCENFQSEEEYSNSIIQIREILKGNLHNVIIYLKSLMNKLANDLKFEEANVLKVKIDSLEKYHSKSVIVNPKIRDLDVFSFEDEEKSAFINFIKVINGCIVNSHTIEIIKKIDEEKTDLLLFVIINLRERFNSTANEVIVPFNPGVNVKNIKFLVPNRGDKKKLLELSFRNLNTYRIEKKNRAEQIIDSKKQNNILTQLQIDLRLKEFPVHIECFDNSNIQGKFPVASCVVFIKGKPKKSEYRHYNIKSVIGPDDFASMREIILRRYKRVLSENKPLPQLIIIDGGKGQLNMALKSLYELDLEDKVAVIGIAKKLESIYFPYDNVPLYINKNSSSLKLIQKIRNEAHRFGISFHRDKRDKNLLQTGIEKIPGIGNITIQKLINHLENYTKIKNATLEELEIIIDKKKAASVYNYFKSLPE